MLILIEVVKCVPSWTLTYISIKAVLNKNKQKTPWHDSHSQGGGGAG